MIKSIKEKCIDVELVKKLNNEAQDWTAVCPICGEVLSGSISKLKCHTHGE